MLRDLNHGGSERLPPFDVCIVGAGPAGISLALALAKRKKRVALCEGGGQSWSQGSQHCYVGEVVGDPYFQLEHARLRFLGGSSGHWAGWCRTLDGIDFQKKASHSLAHWPITKPDLDEHLLAACDILEIAPPPPDQIMSDEFGIKRIDFSYSPPVRFGEKYLKMLTESQHIQLYLNANLTRVSLDNGRIRDCRFESLDRKAGTNIQASAYVFAMGGIENSRQLLYQQQLCGGGLYRPSLPVGRYWMEHPIFTLGEALVDQSIVNKKFYSLTERRQVELGVLNCGLRVEGMRLSKTKALVKELLCVAPKAGQWAAERVGKHLVCGVTIRAAWEQAPDYDNRVALSKSTRDILGVPTTELFWRKGELDRKTVHRTVYAFNDWLMKSNFGRLKLEPWLLNHEAYPVADELAGFHHLGGTRMADNPTYGVVDRDCKVFGSQNLYIAGSSVFPSGGHANPTLTIVQLALRLGDHLAKLH